MQYIYAQNVDKYKNNIYYKIYDLTRFNMPIYDKNKKFKILIVFGAAHLDTLGKSLIRHKFMYWVNKLHRLNIIYADNHI